jgi:hypothetical protein
LVGSILVIFLGLKAGLFGFGCRLSFISEKGSGIRLTNIIKFKHFVRDFISCEDGFFVVGDPYTMEGPFKVKQIEVFITKTPQLHSLFDKSPDDPQRVKIYSWDYEFNTPDKLRLKIWFNQNYLKEKIKSDKAIAYYLAARLDELSKYSDSKNRLGYTVAMEFFSYTDKEVGLSYEY